MSTSSALAIIGAAVGSFFGPGGTQLGCIAHHQIGPSLDAQASELTAHPQGNDSEHSREGDNHEHS